MRVRRLTFALNAAIALSAGGFALASCGSGSEPSGTTTDIYDTTTPQTTPTLVVHKTIVEIEVVDGVPVGGIKRVTVDKDDLVSIYVESDVVDEVHVHGYDKTSDVAPGERAVVEFSAVIPGRFEVELEDRGIQIADLTIEP
ncbi:MAG: hypothetical protein ACRDOF_02805 [Gaiellaceae bacterium]